MATMYSVTEIEVPNVYFSVKEGADINTAAINNAAEVVGISQGADGSYHIFLWSASTGTTYPKTLPVWAQGTGPPFGYLTDMNDRGEVVGSKPPGATFLWSASSGMQDLNVLLPANSGMVLTTALDINNNGQILCAYVGPQSERGTKRVCVEPSPLYEHNTSIERRFLKRELGTFSGT